MVQAVADIMARVPLALSPEIVRDAARELRERNVAATDRLHLHDMCGRQLLALHPDDDEDRAVRLQRDKATRRLPATKNGNAVGILSLRDPVLERDSFSALGAIHAASPNN